MKVVFRTSALADIAGIHRYIAHDNLQAAAVVAERIFRATWRLELFPLSGRKGAVEGTRELVVPRLPYIVVYEVTAATVDIIAVFHAAQDRPRRSPSSEG